MLAVLGLLWALRTGRLARFVRGPLADGAAYVAVVGAYAAGRFVIGFARVNPSVLGLQQSQWVALAVLAGVAYWAWRTWAQPSRSS